MSHYANYPPVYGKKEVDPSKLYVPATRRRYSQRLQHSNAPIDVPVTISNIKSNKGLLSGVLHQSFQPEPVQGCNDSLIWFC